MWLLERRTHGASLRCTRYETSSVKKCGKMQQWNIIHGVKTPSIDWHKQMLLMYIQYFFFANKAVS